MRIEYRVERPLRLEAAFTVSGFTVLLGNTGAGKTSLLLAIAGLIPAFGRPFEGLPPQARPVGYLPQDYSLFPHFTALANVAYPLSGAGREEEARRLLSQVGLAGKASSYPYELSGGEQQRVALARALARKPSLLLLDEPTSALDVATRDEVMGEVVDLVHQAGLPALAVSHDSHLAQMADRVAVLDGGVVVQEGAPEEVFARPATFGCARLVGFSNLFSARVSAVEGAEAVLASPAGNYRVPRAPWLKEGLDVCFGIRPEEVMAEHYRATELSPPTSGDDPPESREGGSNVFSGEIVRLNSVGLHLLGVVRGSVDLQFVLPRHLQDRLCLAVGQRLNLRLSSRYLHVLPSAGDPDLSDR